MYYYLDMNSNSAVTRYTFMIETVKQKGWVQMRMVSIERVGAEPQHFIQYDPLIHRWDSGHYMSNTYTSRKTKCPFTKQRVYRVRFCKGDAYLPLTPSETIVRLKPETPSLTLNDIEFNITSDYDTIVKEECITNEHKEMLNKSSGLTDVLLMTSYNRFRRVDFTGTTNEQAIKKILTFYKHKTYRRLVGDHIYFEGFHTIEMNLESLVAIRLGS
jgi:hypothetical protein